MILLQLRDYCMWHKQLLKSCAFEDCLLIRFFITCRYITILYYLNDVEDGRGIAFSVADIKDFNETVSVREIEFLRLNRLD